MLDKIKFKKLWFVLLVLPLVFTPVVRDGKYRVIELFSPLSITGVVPIYELPWYYGGITSEPLGEFHLDGVNHWRERLEESSIDWGRIAYWEAWMLTICFVVNRKRLMAKEIS